MSYHEAVQTDRQLAHTSASDVYLCSLVSQRAEEITDY